MADVPTRLRAAAEHLRASGPTPGRAWCRAWTDEVDAGLKELDSEVEVAGRHCVVAVGGYGRQELCPGSDLDILVLHDNLDGDDLERLVRTVVYPLWDANLKVGYAVRSSKEAVAAVRAELDDATALLDARPLAGDAALLRAVHAEAVQSLQRKPSRFLDSLAAADQDRRIRGGDAAEVLEPDVKSGAGGLRDVQSLRWAAAALVGQAGLDPLVSSAYLGAADRSRLARAYDQLLAERVALHLVADRGEDVLRLDLQDAVARKLGIKDGDSDKDTAAHRLLTEHYRAARTVAHLHARAWALLAADASKGRRRVRKVESEVDGFGITDGVLTFPDDIVLDDPDLPTNLLWTLSTTGAVLDRTAASSLRNMLESSEHEWAWNGARRQRFLDTLMRGWPSLKAMAEIDDVGLLSSIIPEWEPLRGRAQRNPFHRYALDRHAWHAAAELAEVISSESWAAQAHEDLTDPADREALVLGVLLHDVGKAHGEPHAETGIPVAQKICRRLGCDERTVEHVGFLVRQHLVLSDLATRRDVADPELAAQVAGIIGSHERLSMLHLLSAADGRSTGPSAWTSWKASLVATLVSRVRAVLDDKDPEETRTGANVTGREAVDLGPELGADADVIRNHLDLLPDRYAASVTPRAVVRHALMTAKPLELAEVRTRVTPGATDGDEFDELDVVALDRPGLFAKVAGVVALHGGSVLQAHAFAREDGVAVDTFTVARPAGSATSWWAMVEGDVDEAVGGRLALRARVAQKSQKEARRLRRVPDVPTRVSVHDDASDLATVVEVHTQDRVGVLFEITSALAELELDIVVAKILTMGHEVVDAFYVRDATGQPLDANHAEEVRIAIESALSD